MANLSMRRLVNLELEAAKLDGAPAWLTEEHGPSRHWDLIMQALDRFSYATDLLWAKPYVHEIGGNAPTIRLLDHYSDQALEFADAVASATGKAATYHQAAHVAYAMMDHLPNPHQSHMGSRVYTVTELGEMELTSTSERL